MQTKLDVATRLISYYTVDLKNNNVVVCSENGNAKSIESFIKTINDAVDYNMRPEVMKWFNREVAALVGQMGVHLNKYKIERTRRGWHLINDVGEIFDVNELAKTISSENATWVRKLVEDHMMNLMIEYTERETNL